MKSTLKLSFVGFEKPELNRTEFSSVHQQRPIIGIRGSHFLPGAHPFKWSVAFHALSIFFVRAAMLRFASVQPVKPILLGTKGTPAASIDYTLWQVRSLWISDLFGVDSSGRNYLQRILTVLNSRQRKPGPVELYLNSAMLRPQDISIFLDSRELITESDLQQLANNIETYWRPLRQPHSRSNVANSLPHLLRVAA